MTYILNMKKSKRRSLATILNGFRRIRLIIAMHEVKLTEYVTEIARDPTNLQDYNTKLERWAELQMLR